MQPAPRRLEQRTRRVSARSLSRSAVALVTAGIDDAAVGGKSQVAAAPAYLVEDGRNRRGDRQDQNRRATRRGGLEPCERTVEIDAAVAKWHVHVLIGPPLEHPRKHVCEGRGPVCLRITRRAQHEHRHGAGLVREHHGLEVIHARRPVGVEGAKCVPASSLVALGRAAAQEYVRAFPGKREALAKDLDGCARDLRPRRNDGRRDGAAVAQATVGLYGLVLVGEEIESEPVEGALLPAASDETLDPFTHRGAIVTVASIPGTARSRAAPAALWQMLCRGGARRNRDSWRPGA